jgi:hypothetical protein
MMLDKTKKKQIKIEILSTELSKVNLMDYRNVMLEMHYVLKH